MKVFLSKIKEALLSALPITLIVYAISQLPFKGIITNKLQERRAMKRILDADDQQIINFM